MQKLPTRILLAKVGLDGHDRGVKVLARGLRDAGMEVIYTGLWQTPAAAAKAAVEEDADVLGVSFHSAAHMTLVPIIMEEMKARGRPDMPVVIGGIIPPDDVQAMKDAGCAAVLETEASMQSIVDTLTALADKSRAARSAAHANGTLDKWIDAAGKGDRTALGRVLTWIENSSTPDEAAARLKGQTDGTLIVGMTGPPGVGKSTLIGRLLKEFRSRGKQVAVVAVDPASPLTGGALLGDRARMTQNAGDAGVFLRSSASRGQLGGLAPSTAAMVQAIRRSKVDVVMIETVGAGQNDVSVYHLASPLVLLMMPGAGDDLQLEKAGITEVAEIFVINKADLPGATRLEAQIRDTLGSGRPIVQTVASHGQGISELADAILAHKPKARR
ncbi:MAG: hypothetical protein DCC65_15945 [Planctomycetota bacterium]|nr:MAG: hypothetical protein DCC65_15945 [Planctomycetota bacterium]